MQFGLGDLRVTQEQVPEIRTKDGKDGGFKLPIVCASNPSATRGENTRTNNKIFISPLYVTPRGELSEFANEQRPLGPCPDAEFPSCRHRGDPAGGPPQLTLQVAPVFPPAATVT